MSKLKALKKDTQTKKYLILLGKLTQLFKRFPKDKSFSAKDRQYLSYCLAELYFKSQRMSKVIKNISDTNLKIKSKNLNSLITNLIDLQLNINIEMGDWIRNLKKPLKSLINAIEKSNPEERTFIAEKNISISTKRIDSLLKKIKFCSPS